MINIEKDKTRWLVVLPTEQHEWLKDMVRETKLKGSLIIAELIDRCYNNKDFSRQLRSSLATSQLKHRMQKINDKRASLDEEMRRLKAEFGEKVPV